MPLWGKAHASTSNKPKFAPVDENSPHNRGDIYATNKGWVRKAGTKASGNGNANAEPEVLVAIGGLAGSSSTTGLRAPTITRTRFVVGTTDNTDFTANDANFQCEVEITFDEAVTVTGSPTLTVTNGEAGGPGGVVCAPTPGGGCFNVATAGKSTAGGRAPIPSTAG